MLQPFASPRDHDGTLSCTDEEICLHPRHPWGVSQIPKCLVKNAGDWLPSGHAASHSNGISAVVKEKALKTFQRINACSFWGCGRLTAS
jgi:hypothetical protein